MEVNAMKHSERVTHAARFLSFLGADDCSLASINKPPYNLLSHSVACRWETAREEEQEQEAEAATGTTRQRRRGAEISAGGGGS